MPNAQENAYRLAAVVKPTALKLTVELETMSKMKMPLLNDHYLNLFLEICFSFFRQ